MLILTVLLFTLGFTLSTQAEVWRYATEESPGDVQDIYARAFAKSIEAQSNGDIEVKIYYYGQIGSENDIIELAANGTINFVSVGAGHLGSYVPEVQIVGLPYLLSRDEDATHQLLTSSKTIYQDLSPKLEKINLKLLSMLSEGEMVWGSNKPIRTPEDFKNQKIRTFTSTLPVETYRTFGATPTPLSWGEVYGSLQLKTIDGMVNPINFIYSAKWHEVQDYLIFSDLQPYIATFSASNKWFNRLTTDQKQIIKIATQAADKAGFDYQLRTNRDDMANILKEKPSIQIIRLSDAERERFALLSEELHETYFKVVENAYPSNEKVAARELAIRLLQNLTNEIQTPQSKIHEK